MRSHTLTLTLSLFLALAAASQGQNPSVAPPILDLVQDGSQAFRPLIGIAESASISAQINVGVDLDRSVVAATNQGFMLATTSDTHVPVLFRIRNGQVVAESMDGLFKKLSGQSECLDVASYGLGVRNASCGARSVSIQTPAIDRAVLSPSGSAAVLFSAAQGRIYSFVNMAQTPTMLADYEVGYLGVASALAISDDGRSVVAAFSNVLYLFSGVTTRLIGRLEHPSSIQFFRNSSRAVVADDAENAIYIASDTEFFPIARAVPSPAALAVSRNNDTIFVANALAGSVTTVRLNGSVSAPLYCNCTVTGLHATNSSAVFRVTEFNGGPVVLLDTSNAEPRFIFVPVGGQ